MLHALLLVAGLAVGSFAVAVVLVLTLIRVLGQLDDELAPDRRAGKGRWDRAPRRFNRRGEPWWWRDFEREFADHVRAGAGRES